MLFTDVLCAKEPFTLIEIYMYEYTSIVLRYVAIEIKCTSQMIEVVPVVYSYLLLCAYS